MDLTKRDMALIYGERSFTIRVYRDESGIEAPGWCAIIIENRTPLRHELGRTTSLAECFAGAVGFLTAVVEAQPRARICRRVTRTPSRRVRLSRYEIVAHVSLELEDTTPETAAATFRRDLLARAGRDVVISGLAVWRPTTEKAAAPLPVPLQQQLAHFFAGVARCAAVAETAFRARVERIFASEDPGAASVALVWQPAIVAMESPTADGPGSEDWGGERSLGASTRRGDHDDRIGLPWS